ncbi:aminotransferase class I/II-fold pyridoxal phosphate-dependent enzyme [Microaerobacter geothermalis]|uniref:aminotransferase class I/II-fold pyridoxal phosphate-dependent enzyme n=1 Tax=Microaerobacter geothermalis TaxID=674972 RepID=UPI001F44AEB5|nr:aminotransferase class I/II-fold pyridoxal phosphate-dependent enzyme [Microaerobacter geothermalis]MCF6095140.1 aminotransferase class I/II-fold pyridoxal phosphate-dependent enzyme [Microaerobacter geothermalis]
MERKCKHNSAPLFEALVKHWEQNPISLHVPGHKHGRFFSSEGKKWFSSILSLDATELNDLDDLHHPEGPIFQAQELAADAFKADESHFLVGGSTVGNIALLLSVCGQGDKIIIQRNAHKSVFHAILLSRAQPVYIRPQIEADWGIATSILVEDLKKLLEEHKDVRAVFLTNPNYYGMGIFLDKVAEVVHSYGIPLLVDEAHGAHFGFAKELPPRGIESGADGVVQSTHKMLSAMTMGAMLHIKGNRINRDLVKEWLTILQSSSPSFPIMASLDLARKEAVQMGEEGFCKAVGYADHLRSFLNQWNEWFYIPSPNEKRKTYDYIDPLKITIVLKRGITGFQLQRRLEELGIYVELADVHLLLMVLSPGIQEAEMDRICKIFNKIMDQIEQEKGKWFHSFHFPSQTFFSGNPVIPPYKVKTSPVKSVPLTEAIGKIAGEMVIPYPPGVPVITLGEIIERDVVEHIMKLREQGMRFQGISDPHVKNIRVLI